MRSPPEVRSIDAWDGRIDYFTDIATAVLNPDVDEDSAADVTPAWALVAARLVASHTGAHS